MEETKSGKKRRAALHRNAMNVLFNKYMEDPTNGVSYEQVDCESSDYCDSVYDNNTIFQETEKRYFKKHMNDVASKFRIELEERGTRRSEFFSYLFSVFSFSFPLLLIYFVSFFKILLATTLLQLVRNHLYLQKKKRRKNHHHQRSLHQRRRRKQRKK